MNNYSANNGGGNDGNVGVDTNYGNVSVGNINWNDVGNVSGNSYNFGDLFAAAVGQGNNDEENITQERE